jgi:PAS domain S-box-containing protein
MTDTSPVRRDLGAAHVALLGEREALQRLDLLATASRLLDSALDDYDAVMDSVAEACTTDFADLCAIEIIGVDGTVRAIGYRVVKSSALNASPEWDPIGRVAAPDRRPVLVYSGSEGSSSAQEIRERLGAQSLLVSPISGGGLTLGWFVAATGEAKRGLRPSALRVATDLSSRIGTAIQRVMMHREMQAAAREQGRAVRRLRRLATAATNLAGAATPQSVLETACVEACLIHEADGAVASWVKADGTRVIGRAGEVDVAVADSALEAVSSGRSHRGRGWIAYPLPNTDPWQHAGLVVFIGEEFTREEELVLSSLASLIPVAFERALGTEAALKHEARFRAVVDTSPVALVELDHTGFVAMANRAAQDLFGWHAAPGSWVLSDDVKEPLMALTHEVLASGAVVTRSLDVAGREWSVSAARLPAVYSAESPSVLVAGVDVTDLHRAEKALVQAQRLDAMGQVAGRVAHDFNNLLTLIVGYASLLRRSLEGTNLVDLVANIEEATKRAGRLTQQMLDMTRQKVDSGAVIDLGTSVAELDAVLAKLAGPKVDLQIRTRGGPILVRLDPSEMEQIVVNLVINACDALDDSGTVRVTVEGPVDAAATIDRGQSGGPMALLRVEDDGPGMTEEVLARCLEPFFTTKDRGRGSGLGLPTVHGLVQARGGHMHIDSKPGEGTRIRIWLPITTEGKSAASSREENPWIPGCKISGRVLLVEDEDDLRRMAAETLSSVGLEVAEAATGERALDMFGDGAGFDAIVTDVMLPQMSGFEMVKAARAVRPDVPVIYVTGYTGDQNMPEGQRDTLIRKPYSPDTLRVRVAEVLEGARKPG